MHMGLTTSVQLQPLSWMGVLGFCCAAVYILGGSRRVVNGRLLGLIWWAPWSDTHWLGAAAIDCNQLCCGLKVRSARQQANCPCHLHPCHAWLRLQCNLAVGLGLKVTPLRSWGINRQLTAAAAGGNVGGRHSRFP
mgnify:CR=1 FL=1